MDEDNRPRFGECPLCSEKDKWLYFALGSHKGNIWCKWICRECLDKIRNNVTK